MSNAKLICAGIHALKPNAGKARIKFEPTLSFNEVVAKYELNTAKFRVSLRAANAPRAEINFPSNRRRGSVTYYARSTICQWVEANLEKLK